MLALFCYRRSHLHALAVAIAASCTERELVHFGGRVGSTLYALSRDSRDEVDAMVEAAAKAGGRADVRETQDMGFLYVRTFADPDGNVFEPAWMDMSAMADA